MHEPLSTEELARYEAVLRRLPERTLAIFCAHRVDGKSYAQIAAETGLSERRVRNIMCDAIRRIVRDIRR
jgi:RNA polymerase sigma-70 factor (ECF subfamily)